jgi:hypothetical protein
MWQRNAGRSVLPRLTLLTLAGTPRNFLHPERQIRICLKGNRRTSIDGRKRRILCHATGAKIQVQTVSQGDVINGGRDHS